jgi:diguanylate cyclase (GGDEF)-like protein
LQAHEEQVRQLAFYDALTGLPNRRLLHDRLNQTLAASRRSGCYGALMFLDLDNFKPLNDTHGHGVGDLLLKTVASRLSECVRAMDTVARLGGDEFVVMLSELDADVTLSSERARSVAEKVRSTLAEPYELRVASDDVGATVKHLCSASIGVVMFEGSGADLDSILKQADAAMYQAKNAGRNTIRFFSQPDTV